MANARLRGGRRHRARARGRGATGPRRAGPRIRPIAGLDRHSTASHSTRVRCLCAWTARGEMDRLRPEYMHPSCCLEATTFEILTGGIAIVTLDRPSALNSLSADLVSEVEHHFKYCDLANDVRVVILTGNPESKTSRGQTIFCAGADLAPKDGAAFAGDKASSRPAGEGEPAKPSPAATHRDGGGLLSLAINRCRKPVIAAINGTAVGGGLTPTLAADVRIVSESASLGFVFARRGIVPEAACGYFLPKLVGIGLALEWCMTGRVFPAAEAQGSGLFNHLVPEDDVMPKAMEIATEIVDNCSPSSITLTKAMLWKQLDNSSPEQAHLLDSRLLQWSFNQPDSEEGVKSFIEKRSPKFRLTGELPDMYPWWTEIDTKSRM